MTVTQDDLKKLTEEEVIKFLRENRREIIRRVEKRLKQKPKEAAP